VLVTVHWAARFDSGKVRGALLATPPDLAAELPAEYPSLAVLKTHGWLPIPRRLLPFPSVVATSGNDPLSDPLRVRALAKAWGSRIHPLGPVGHLNPASGYGEWPLAHQLVDELLEAIR
jgi:predicted alpha/beta hydrolase family esterase